VEDLLYFGLCCESGSEHPLGQSIAQAANDRFRNPFTGWVQEHYWVGSLRLVDGKPVLVGAPPPTVGIH